MVWPSYTMMTCVSKVSPTTTFEVAVIRFIVSVQTFFIAKIYRPPGTGIDVFLDELGNLFDVLSETGGHHTILGDFNCPGKIDETMDHRLKMLLLCYNVVSVISGPTSHTEQWWNEQT